MSANKGLSSRAIIGSFYNALEANTAASWVDSVGMKFNSDQETETYTWLGQVNPMREWKGGREAGGLWENSVTIANKTYESTLEIPVDWIRRDKTGQIMVRVNEQATRATTHWQSLLSTLIINGESTACYDGQFFFDTDHTEGENTSSQSNDLAASATSATAPTAAEIEAATLNAMEAILGFKDNASEPMNELAREFLLMVPTPYFGTAVKALNLPMVNSGESNVFQNMNGYTVRLAMNPRLTWTTKMALYRTDGNVKPFILQEEEGVTVQAIAEGSELEFNNNVHRYGIKAIRNVGYGYWQHAALVTFS